uniref:Mitochondrial carrier protein n=1 Tax=Amorphochlora amoebiformis TaxID=1561963 RepID=A0A7S0GQL7_9EUKA
MLKVMAASTLSGLVARIPMHPIDTLKAKLQVQVKGNYSSMASVAMRTIREGGVAGLYAGFPTAFLGSAPASCLYWTSYEASKKVLFKVKLMVDNPNLAHFTAGFLAEVFSCVLWVPIDVVKERLQVQSDLKSAYKGNIDAIKTIYRTEGWGGVYKGYGATVLSFGPFSAVWLMLNEKFKLMAQSALGVTSPKDIPFVVFMATGASAGSIAALLTNPLDKAKLRLQVQRAQMAQGGKQAANRFYYRGFFDALWSIYSIEGAAGLFRGAGARVLFQAPSTAISIACFDWLRARLL